MDNNLTYFIILIIAVAGPLLLSFDKKVAFYKDWKFVFPAMIIPAVFYIIWDSWFTEIGVWDFNEKFITGILYFGLPIEEILFFFIVPYCCVFIYACIRAYFPGMLCTRNADYVFGLISLSLLIVGLIFRDKLYTASTFLLCSLFITIFLAGRKYFSHFHSNAFLISYLIIIIPFLVMNGILTSLPVVIYNDAENMGLRIYSIPVEDIFYGLLLIMMNVLIYEKLKSSISNKKIIKK